MGREVRRVPADWQHPQHESWTDRTGFKPLLSDYREAHDGFIEKLNAEGLQPALDYYGRAPDQSDYMPEWPEEQCTHLMMYEDTSEGTPISPAFATPEELARWLADNGASSFAGTTATYEQWLGVCQGRWAPSMAVADGKMMSGVEALGEPS